MSYYEKVKTFNLREDYKHDVNIAKLLLTYCISFTHKIFIIGTGLGGDLKILNDFNDVKIVGIEPRPEFHFQVESTYKKFGARILKMDLKQFVKKSKKISGICLFIHSINHIPENQIKLFARYIQKNSFIVIINPNPQIGKIIGKTDKTVITYLNSKKIQKLLNCDILFDFFYNPIKIKGSEVFLREAILLKTKN